MRSLLAAITVIPVLVVGLILAGSSNHRIDYATSAPVHAASRTSVTGRTEARTASHVTRATIRRQPIAPAHATRPNTAVRPHPAAPARPAPTTSTTSTPPTTTPPPTTPPPTTPPATTTPPTTTQLASQPTSGCGAAIAYLKAHAAPGFTLECPGNAFGHQAMTCIDEPGMCPNSKVIAIAIACPASWMNEASNSWVLTGQSNAPIDPYGYCQ